MSFIRSEGRGISEQEANDKPTGQVHRNERNESNLESMGRADEKMTDQMIICNDP